MLTGIDHLVIACADPDAAAAELEATLGLRATGGGEHPRFGTWNRLVWLGDAYLELIGIRDERLAAESWLGRPTLARLAEAGAGLVTWAVATDDLDADAALLRTRGADLFEPIDGERVRPDGRVVRWRLAAPRRLGPLEPPFLIWHDPTAAEWTADERAARMAEAHPLGGPVRLVALELPVASTHRDSLRYLTSGIGPFRPSLAGRGARDAAVGHETLRLVPVAPGAGAGTTTPDATIRLRAEAAIEPRAVERLGCRFVLTGTQRV